MWFENSRSSYKGLLGSKMFPYLRCCLKIKYPKITHSVSSCSIFSPFFNSQLGLQSPDFHKLCPTKIALKSPWNPHETSIPRGPSSSSTEDRLLWHSTCAVIGTPSATKGAKSEILSIERCRWWKIWTFYGKIIRGAHGDMRFSGEFHRISEDFMGCS